MFEEFKKFISKGNIVDIGVAFVMASAFGSVTSAFVDNILMAIIGAVTAGIDFSKITITILGVTLGVGIFLNSIIKFLIISFFMFLIVKEFNKLKKHEKAKVTTKTCEYCKSKIDIDATRCPHCTSQLK